MPVVSHQVKFRLLTVAFSASISAMAGCTTSAPAKPSPRQVIQVPTSDNNMRIDIYGDLLVRHVSRPTQSRLERYVFGPETVARSPLRNPQGLTVHDERVYVCDQGLPDIVTIDLKTGRSARFTRGADRPACPVDVAVDHSGRVYVADTTRDAVLIYDADGRLMEATSPGAAGAHGQSFEPAALSIDGDQLYVGDAENGQVWVVHLPTNQWRQSPEAGGRNASITGLSRDRNGALLFVDALRGQVHRRSADGNGDAAIGSRGRAFGQFVRPIHACVAASGHVLVTDAARQSLIVFDATGRAVAEWPAENVADAARRWTLPMGVVAFRMDQPEALLSAMGFHDAPAPDEFVLVTDALGPVSLTLLGLTYGSSLKGGM